MHRSPLHTPAERAPNRPKGFWSGHAYFHQETERAGQVTVDKAGGGGLIAAVGCLNYYRCRKQSSSSCTNNVRVKLTSSIDIILPLPDIVGSAVYHFHGKTALRTNGGAGKRPLAEENVLSI